MTIRDRQDPYNAIASVTPSNTVDLPVDFLVTGIIVGGAGNVAITTTAGYEDVITPPVNVIHPVSVARIKATGTTATSIKVVGLKG